MNPFKLVDRYTASWVPEERFIKVKVKKEFFLKLDNIRNKIRFKKSFLGEQVNDSTGLKILQRKSWS